MSVRSIATNVGTDPSEHWPLPGTSGGIWPDLFGRESKLHTQVPSDWSYKQLKIIFRGVKR